MLVNMKKILEDAEKGGYAIGCINTPKLLEQLLAQLKI